jgi:nucleotide-binding universal stress UspA family protein
MPVSNSQDDPGVVGRPPGEMLVLLALSPTSGLVAREASRLSRSLGLRIRFLHVGARTPAIHSRLQTLLEHSLTEPGGDVTFRTGRIEDVVAEEAQASDLVVLGALEQEGPLGAFFSSVARRVARTAPCPTLLLPSPNPNPEPFRRLVAVMDPSTPSPEMLRDVLELARAEQVEMLHVVQELELPALNLALEEGADLDQTEEERRVNALAARHRLANLLEDCQADQVPIRVESLAGREGLEAIRYSQENSADLLIVPAPERDQSTVLERLFPRGTDLTLLNLPCALLAWRPRRTP